MRMLGDSRPGGREEGKAKAEPCLGTGRGGGCCWGAGELMVTDKRRGSRASSGGLEGGAQIPHNKPQTDSADETKARPWHVWEKRFPSVFPLGSLPADKETPEGRKPVWKGGLAHPAA